MSSDAAASLVRRCCKPRQTGALPQNQPRLHYGANTKSTPQDDQRLPSTPQNNILSCPRNTDQIHFTFQYRGAMMCGTSLIEGERQASSPTPLPKKTQFSQPTHAQPQCTSMQYYAAHSKTACSYTWGAAMRFVMKKQLYLRA